jgi:regulation of enolase protein 1 (concanavalin A-like superfamily)
MSSKSHMVIALLLAIFLCFTTFSCAFASVGYNDEFTTTSLNSFWTTSGNAGATYSLTANSGWLNITSPAGCDLGGGANDAPRVLQTVSGDFEAYTKLPTTTTGVHAGLLIFVDNTHFMRVEERDANTVQIGGINGGSGFIYSITSLGTAPTPIYIKLEREASTIEGYWSSDGIVYNTFGSEPLSVSDPVQIGLFVVNVGSCTSSVDFDYFHIVPGNTFDLPEYTLGLIAVPLAMAAGFIVFQSRQKIKIPQ